jgi:hypothetical protein
MIKKVTIYGERCSGTNYLEELLLTNFDVSKNIKYGHKHFFGFNDLSGSDDTLFIGIIRNPYDWLNSLYREQHHLPPHFREKTNFLNSEFYSLDDNKSEYMTDRNIYTKERYQNIFEMRYTKIKFLMEDMPQLVKNYILIKYEDLLNNFNITINKIRSKGLIIKPDVHYPINIVYYKKEKKRRFERNNTKINHLSKEEIIDKLNMYYEKTVLNYDI